MDIRQLNAFWAVSRTGSITRAAAMLGYSQSAVTAQIKNLESAVRTRLFERRRDGVRLTPGGERFLPYANRLLRLSEEAVSALAPEAPLTGRMTIGASESLTTYRLPDVIRHFHAAHPDVHLMLRTFHEGPDHMMEALVRGDVDIALTHCIDPGPVGVPARRLAPEPLALVAPPDHPMAAGDAVTTDELRRTRTLIVQASCVYDTALRASLPGVRAVPPLQFGTIEAVKTAVRSGLGVALLPRVAVTEQLRTGELVELRWEPGVTISSYVLLGKEQDGSQLLSALDSLLDRVVREWHQPAAAHVPCDELG
ncbi:LysR family transcriptional regulator [Saccharothrix xinjiangensis]|uniref:LysR family transcriptional regulator n=1 Tax=Saccharothrix xinjiangensis TaxID=204798 RepID=A0ABV9Y701_9PSEU